MPTTYRISRYASIRLSCSCSQLFCASSGISPAGSGDAAFAVALGAGRMLFSCSSEKSQSRKVRKVVA